MKPAERITDEPRPTPIRRRRTRTIAIVAGVVVALALAAIGIRAARKPAAPKYETAKVDRGRIVAKVTATGTLSALVTVQVGSQVSGRIQRLYADFNCPGEEGAAHRQDRPAALPGRARAGARQPTSPPRQTSPRPRSRPPTRSGSSRGPAALAERKLIAQADLDTAQANADAAQAAVECGRRGHGRPGARRAPPGRGEPRLHDHRLAHRRRRSSRATSTSARPSPPRSRRPPLFVIAEDLRQDAGRHQRGRGRHRQARGRHGGDLHGRRLPGGALPGDGAPDPQRAADGAERRHLRRGHRRREPRAQAAARHDRERDLRLRRAPGRPARPQRRAALPAAGRPARGRPTRRNWRDRRDRRQRLRPAPRRGGHA